MNGNFARSILCSLVTSVDFGWYSSIVGICCFCPDWSCCMVTARGQTMSAANMATKMTEKRVLVRREFILPLGFLNVRLLSSHRSWTSAVESSANISDNASAQDVPFPLARCAGRDCRVSCAGHRRAHRAASLCAVDCSFFTRPEAGRIHHAGNSQIYGVDLRLVLAHSHRRQRHFLLRDLRLDCRSEERRVGKECRSRWS